MKPKEKTALLASLAKQADEIRSLPNITGAVVVVMTEEGQLFYEYRVPRKIGDALMCEAMFIAEETEARPMDPEKLKMANMEEMLAQVEDPEDRAAMEEAIKSMFTKDGMRGMRPTRKLSPGQPTICKACDEPLRKVGASLAQNPDFPTEENFVCTGCGGGYSREIEAAKHA